MLSTFIHRIKLGLSSSSLLFLLSTWFCQLEEMFHYQAQHWPIIELSPVHVILDLGISLNLFSSHLSQRAFTIWVTGSLLTTMFIVAYLCDGHILTKQIWLALKRCLKYIQELQKSHGLCQCLIGGFPARICLYTILMQSAEQCGWKCKSSPFKSLWAKHGLYGYICWNLHAQW